MTDTTTNGAGEKRAMRAKHEFIAAKDGEAVSIEEAKGIRYTDLETGGKFEWIIPDGKPMLMCALFGAKTKATNETSRIRQTKGQTGTGADQLEALDEVFESISNGVWREQAEGGGGSRTDRGLLATVLLEMLGQSAKGDHAFYTKRLTDDVAYLRNVLKSDAGTEYRKRAGKGGPSLDSLA